MRGCRVTSALAVFMRYHRDSDVLLWYFTWCRCTTAVFTCDINAPLRALGFNVSLWYHGATVLPMKCHSGRSVFLLYLCHVIVVSLYRSGCFEPMYLCGYDVPLRFVRCYSGTEVHLLRSCGTTVVTLCCSGVSIWYVCHCGIQYTTVTSLCHCVPLQR